MDDERLSNYSEIKDLHSLQDPDGLYELLQCVGSGTYGKVYKAIRKDAAKEVAAKIMKIEPEDEPLLLDEINILIRASEHKNVAKFYGAYTKKKSSVILDELWICMEYCGRGALNSFIKKLRPEPFKEHWILYITQNVLEGIQYLHSRHIVHRDIKSHNILLTDNVRIKLVDFGVSAHMERTMSRRNTFIGTPYWMAPEVILCQEDNANETYGLSCDIWSVGITAIEMAEGKPPLSDCHPMRALLLIAKQNPPSLKNKSAWSENFNEFLSYCLMRDPKKRKTAEELLATPFMKRLTKETTKKAIRELKEWDTSRESSKSVISSDSQADESLDNDESGVDEISTVSDTQSLRLKLAEMQGFDKESNENKTIESNDARLDSNTILKAKAAKINVLPNKDNKKPFGNLFKSKRKEANSSSNNFFNISSIYESYLNLILKINFDTDESNYEKIVTNDPNLKNLISLKKLISSSTDISESIKNNKEKFEIKPKRYKTKIKSNLNHACLWGINPVLCFDNGLYLLDKSGNGAIIPMVTGVLFKMADVLEAYNLLISIATPDNQLRIYMLSSFKRITDPSAHHKKKEAPEFHSLLENKNCSTYKIICIHKVLLLIAAVDNTIEIFAWSGANVNKFMPFKTFSNLNRVPKMIYAGIKNKKVLSIFYTSEIGFHGFELDSDEIYDIWLPNHGYPCRTHCMCIRNENDNFRLFLFAYSDVKEAIFEDSINIVHIYSFNDQPVLLTPIMNNSKLLVLNENSIEIREIESGNIVGAFISEKSYNLKTLCERNGKFFFTNFTKPLPSVYCMDVTMGCRILNFDK